MTKIKDTKKINPDDVPLCFFNADIGCMSRFRKNGAKLIPKEGETLNFLNVMVIMGCLDCVYYRPEKLANRTKKIIVKKYADS